MNLGKYEMDLRRQLSELSSVARIAFAVSCAERLRTAYSRSLSAETERLIRRALDIAWAGAAGAGVATAETRVLQSILEANLRPDDELVEGEADLQAQTLLRAALYVLRQVDRKDGEDAFWVARQITDAIDQRAQSTLDVGLLSREGERTLAANPHIENEIRRQLTDIAEASRVQDGGSSLDSLRNRAQLADALFERALGLGAAET